MTTSERETFLTRAIQGLVLILCLNPFMTLTRGENTILTRRGIQMVSGTTISTTVPLTPPDALLSP